MRSYIKTGIYCNISQISYVCVHAKIFNFYTLPSQLMTKRHILIRDSRIFQIDLKAMLDFYIDAALSNVLNKANII